MAQKVSFSRYQSYTTQKKNRERYFKIFLTILIVYLAYLIINAVFIRTVRWESASMEPSLKKNVSVLVSPLPFGNNNIPFLPFGLPGFTTPQRGEMVLVVPAYHVVSPPWITAADEVVRFFTLNFVSIEDKTHDDWDRDYTLRRVIGLPGDTVKMDNYTAQVRPKGESYFLSEYELSKKIYSVKDEGVIGDWKPQYPLSDNMKAITLKDDEYFVLADNRTASSDSRTWGVVKKTAIKGLALAKYWPLSQFGGL